MNKTTSFHLALFLVFCAKFHPARLFWTARLFNCCQNSRLHAYSGLFRSVRLFGTLEYFLVGSSFSSEIQIPTLLFLNCGYFCRILGHFCFQVSGGSKRQQMLNDVEEKLYCFRMNESLKVLSAS